VDGRQQQQHRQGHEQGGLDALEQPEAVGGVEELQARPAAAVNPSTAAPAIR
jgi:hypothetical protein